MKAQEAIQTELMGIRFTARRRWSACADTLRSQVDEVRKLERAVLHIVVDTCRHAARDFIAPLPAATRPTCSGS